MPAKLSNPYNQALNILSHRDHSVFELTTKLKRKRFSQKEISDTVKKLKIAKLLNDNKFTQIYITSTLRAKPVGPRWLKYKLKRKGISDTTIEHTLSLAYQSGTEEKLAKQAAQQWRRSHAKFSNDKQRLMRFLQSRGFSYKATRQYLP